MELTIEVLRQRMTKAKVYPVLEIPNLVPEESWGPTTYPPMGRHYQTPTGKVYMSATTFLKQFEDPHALDKWRERVGAEEAERIGIEARHRGELIHAKLEAYVRGLPGWESMPVEKWGNMFSQIRRRLEDSLDKVCYLEHALWSDELQVAGRVDMCGIWRGELAIIDFKNKSRFTKRENIESYFIQTALYALMHQERYGVLPGKLVILAAVENHGTYKCMQFEEDTVDYIDRVRQMAALVQQYGDKVPPEYIKLMEYQGPVKARKPRSAAKPAQVTPTPKPPATKALSAFFGA